MIKIFDTNIKTFFLIITSQRETIFLFQFEISSDQIGDDDLINNSFHLRTIIKLEIESEETR